MSVIDEGVRVGLKRRNCNVKKRRDESWLRLLWRIEHPLRFTAVTEYTRGQSHPSRSSKLLQDDGLVVQQNGWGNCGPGGYGTCMAICNSRPLRGGTHRIEFEVQRCGAKCFLGVVHENYAATFPYCSPLAEMDIYGPRNKFPFAVCLQHMEYSKRNGIVVSTYSGDESGMVAKELRANTPLLPTRMGLLTRSVRPGDRIALEFDRDRSALQMFSNGLRPSTMRFANFDAFRWAVWFDHGGQWSLRIVSE